MTCNVFLCREPSIQNCVEYCSIGHLNLIENDNCSVDIHRLLKKMRTYVTVNEH